MLTALLTALALPALAGAAVKVTVLAAATADEDPNDWDVALSVSGDVVVVEDLNFKGARLWKIVAKGDVVDPGDSLTTEVDLGDETTAQYTATCGPGPQRLHSITAICQ